MPKKSKRPTLEEELAELEVACRDPGSDETREALRRALGSRPSLIAQRAARIVRRHRIERLMDDLKRALVRFLDDPAKSDPGCRAKAAILDTLDYLECTDATPFLTAARHYQKEPAFGGAVETAAALRARAIAGLARIGSSDFLLHAGRLLADSESPVRQAVLDALVHYGERSGAGLTLLKLRLGDPDPLVTLACMRTLLALAPDWALEEMRPMLFGADEHLRESAIVALSESRCEQSFPLLLEVLERSAIPDERGTILRAMGLSRDASARAYLLEVVARGTRTDAQAAVLALSGQRFEPGLRGHVEEAARRNAELSSFLEKTISEAFGCRPTD